MKEKPIVEKDMPCPHCGKAVHLKVQAETIVKPIPGERKINVFFEKGTQTTLVKK